MSLVAMMTMKTGTLQTLPTPTPLPLLRVPPEGCGLLVPPSKGSIKGHLHFSSVLEVVPVLGPVADNPPPPLDQVQPGRTSGQEVEIEPRMAKVSQQGCHAGMEGEIVYPYVNLPLREPTVYLVHENGEAGAVPTPPIVQKSFPGVGMERAKEPDISPAAMIWLVVGTMAGLSPLALGGVKLGGYWPLLIHTDHRAALRWSGVEAHDVPLFSGYSGSVVSQQVRPRCHQRTPSSRNISHRRVRLTGMLSWWAASRRVSRVQWQAPWASGRPSLGGLLASITSRPRSASVRVGFRPERGWSSRALRPSCWNRLRSRRAISEETPPTLAAAWGPEAPWARCLSSCARFTCTAGAVRLAASFSIPFHSSSVRVRNFKARIAGLQEQDHGAQYTTLFTG